MKINILHILDSLTIGGVQKIVMSVLKYTDREKFEHFVAYAKGGALESEFRKQGVHLFKIQDSNLRFKDFCGISILRKLINYIEVNKIDIAHTYLFVPYFFGTIAAKVTGIPIINHVNTEEYRKQTRTERILKGNIVSSHPILNRILMRFTDMTITTSQNAQSELSKLTSDKNKVRIVYNGTDIPEENLSQIENVKMTYCLNAKHYVCSIGRLCKQKNQMLLLRAIPLIVKEFSDVQFIIVGDGPTKEELKATAKDLNLDNLVIFTGALLDIYPILELADIFVLTSVWEQHPIAILEAMSMRKPVIAPRIAGIPDTVSDGESGILFEPNDVNQLVNSILTLLKNKEQARVMGKRGLEIINERFLNEKQNKKIEDIYLEIKNYNLKK